MGETLLAIIFIQVDDSLDIGTSRQAVSTCQELLAQLGIVIDLAVYQNPDGSVFVGNRLVAPGDVNNAQAAMPQPDSTIHVYTVVIRPAVAQSLVHGMNFASRDNP